MNLRALLRSLRPHQAVKNLFVLAPAVFSRKLPLPEDLLRAGAAFCLFSALAAGGYLLNDLADRTKDRLHPVKRLRPVASGELPPGEALVAAILLMAGALAGSALLGMECLGWYLAYTVVSLAYSMKLKHIPGLDLACLVGVFLLRILAGAAAVHVQASLWILLCGGLLSLFLALAKRRAELNLPSPIPARPALAHYSRPFLDRSLPTCATCGALAYIFYTLSPETTRHFGSSWMPLTALWPALGLLRYLRLIRRGAGQDVAVDLLNDPPALTILALWVLSLAFAIYGPLRSS